MLVLVAYGCDTLQQLNIASALTFLVLVLVAYGCDTQQQLNIASALTCLVLVVVTCSRS